MSESLIALTMTKDKVWLMYIQSIEDGGLKLESIFTQCYDGSSVMSDCTSDIQKIVQQKIGKEIPDVHCFIHPLHLILVYANEEISDVDLFFGACKTHL